MFLNRRPLTLLISVLVTSVASLPMAMAQEIPEPSQIVEKVIQAYGGRAALERVKVVKHTGRIQSHRLGKTGSMVRVFVLPGTLHVDVNYPGGPVEQRITTPEGAWRDGNPATEPMHRAMELQAARFSLPLLLTKHPVSVVGDDGGKIHLRATLTESTTLEVFVDQRSGHIVRSVGNMAMGGMSLAFTADYSEFSMVDGVLFAHREALTAMGMPTGIALLDKIEVNGKASTVLFAPEKIQAGKM